MNDVAMAAHYAAVADYPAFFWDRDDGLLVVGFPKNEFWTMTLTYPASTVRNFPLYVLLIFAVDLGILYTIYAVSRRRTQNAVAPIAEALDALSDGRAAELHLKGDLRDIGDQITETSAVIEQKDAARASWIRGISHDIRTPLSMILGYADALVQDEGAAEEARASARVIRAQGLKIKDLVTDLNTASQLDYDMQPMRLERVHAARLLRTVAAAHANSGLDEAHPIELDIAEDALNAVVLGDERLLTRAVENAISNARLHNEQGCTISVELALRDNAYCTIRERRRCWNRGCRPRRARSAPRALAHGAQRGWVVQPRSRPGARSGRPHRPRARGIALPRRRAGRRLLRDPRPPAGVATEGFTLRRRRCR